MSFWDQWAGQPGWDTVQGSQAYTEGASKLQHDLYTTLRKYGVEPTDSQLDILGMTRQQWNANSADPNSVVAMLQRSRVGGDHSTINAANDAGLEESGALASGLNANGQEYARGYQGAVTGAGGEADTEIGDFTHTVGGAFNTAEQNAVPPVTPPTPPMTNVSDWQGSAATGTSDYKPVTDPNPWHIPNAQGNDVVTGQGQGVAGKLKRPKAPVFGGQGHIT